MLVKAFPRLASNPGPTAMMAAPTIAARTAYSTAVMPRSSRFKMAIVLRKLFIVWSFSFSKPGLFHRRAPGRRGENSAHKHHHSAAPARYPQIENAELHPPRPQPARKSGVSGTRVTARVYNGGGTIIKQK